MNNDRRKEISKIIEMVEGFKDAVEEMKTKITEAKESLETVKDEEQDYIDGMPENLQSSERYYAAEAAISNMDEAFSALEEMSDTFDNFDPDAIITALDTARE